MIQDGKEIATISEEIGIATNNIAEYTALAKALENAINLNCKQIIVNADSELMIKQLKKIYKVKNPELKIIYDKIQDLIKNFESIEFNHVPRNQNKRADALANLAFS